MLVASSNPTREFFFSYQYFHTIFTIFDEMKKVSIILFCILTSCIVCNSFIQSEHMHIELLYKIWPKSLLKVMFLLRAMINQLQFFKML